MANSTWFQTTNYILELAGQIQVSSSINFNNPITGLNRIQSQVRRFVDMCNRMLARKIYNRDRIQEFQLLTRVGNPNVQTSFTYTLDSSIRMESLRYLSFYNITSQGTGNPVGSIPLYNVEYREFREKYPDFTQIPTGPPINWIIMPKSLIGGGAGIQLETIIFFPIPDNVYTINYQAGVKIVPLLLDTDSILFAPDNEDVLWNWGLAFLEDALGEGRGQTMQYYAEQVLKDYMWRMAGPEEERRAIRTGMGIYGPMRGRRVSPFSDTTYS